MSCKKDDPEVTQKNLIHIPDGVSVKDGYLTFKNQEVYEATIQTIIQQEFKLLDDWEKRLGFSSMRTAHSDAYSQYNLDSLIVRSSTFATLLNKEGRVKIGNADWRITKDYAYRTIDGVETKFAMTRTSYPIYEDRARLMATNDCGDKDLEDSNTKYSQPCGTPAFPSRRVIGRIIYDNGLIFNDIIVVTENYIKACDALGGEEDWKTANASEIGAVISYNYSIEGRKTTRSNERLSSSGTWILSKEIAASVNPICIQSFKATHFATRQKESVQLTTKLPVK